MRNKKGFTLIELLAVIVILAIILAIAIPAITKYISQSRQDGTVTTAQDLSRAISKDITSENYVVPIGTDEVTIVSTDLIKLETGGEKSSFGGTWLQNYSYVAVINVGTDIDPEYQYYVALRDSKRYTLALTQDVKIERNSIIRNNSAGTKVPITPMCGTRTGQYQIIPEIIGLEKYEPLGGWSATVYSTVDC